MSAVVVWDEAEYERLTALDVRVVRYPDPVEDDTPPSMRMTFNMLVALDGDEYVLRYYSAQPPPDLKRLPVGTVIVSTHMYLAPHYCVFVRLRPPISALPLFPSEAKQ